MAMIWMMTITITITITIAITIAWDYCNGGAQLCEGIRKLNRVAQHNEINKRDQWIEFSHHKYSQIAKS
jgi:hypothetical protein